MTIMRIEFQIECYCLLNEMCAKVKGMINAFFVILQRF